MTTSSHTPEQTPSVPDSADLIHQQIAEARSRLQDINKTPITLGKMAAPVLRIEAVLASLVELVTMLAVRIEQLQALPPLAQPHESPAAQAAEDNASKQIAAVRKIMGRWREVDYNLDKEITKRVLLALLDEVKPL